MVDLMMLVLGVLNITVYRKVIDGVLFCDFTFIRHSTWLVHFDMYLVRIRPEKIDYFMMMMKIILIKYYNIH